MLAVPILGALMAAVQFHQLDDSFRVCRRRQLSLATNTNKFLDSGENKQIWPTIRFLLFPIRSHEFQMMMC